MTREMVAPVVSGSGLGRITARVAHRLAKSVGTFVPAYALVVAMYGEDSKHWPNTAHSTLRVTLLRLRQRFPGSIGSRYGVGYCLVPDSTLHRFLNQLETQEITE